MLIVARDQFFSPFPFFASIGQTKDLESELVVRGVNLIFSKMEVMISPKLQGFQRSKKRFSSSHGESFGTLFRHVTIPFWQSRPQSERNVMSLRLPSQR